MGVSKMLLCDLAKTQSLALSGTHWAGWLAAWLRSEAAETVLQTQKSRDKCARKYNNDVI